MIKKILFLIIVIQSIVFQKVFATDDAWILWWVSRGKLRDWDIHIDDIPNIIKFASEFILGLAWTIAIIFIIIWAYQLLLWPLDWDKSKGKTTIALALWWLILAALSWFILKLIVDNFS